MKRVSILIIFLLSLLVSIAQTQPGYVKTLGRPEKKRRGSKWCFYTSERRT